VKKRKNKVSVSSAKRTGTDGSDVSPAPLDGQLSAKENFRAWLFRLCLLIMLLWSTRNFLDYGDLLRQLLGKPMIERGYIGSDEWRNFLARSGRIATQRAYASARTQIGEMLNQARHEGRDSVTLRINSRVVVARSVDDLPSDVAEGWRWVVEQQSKLPPDARVYLNVPSMQVYYYATSLWYPRDVDVNWRPTIIRDVNTFLKSFESVGPQQFNQLRMLGYTHIVVATSQGIQLRDLRDSKGGTQE